MIAVGVDTHKGGEPAVLRRGLELVEDALAAPLRDGA
jgi:hypothetical protein